MKKIDNNKYNKVIIFGKDNNHPYFRRNNNLVPGELLIGDGVKSMTPQGVKKELETHKEKISTDAVFCITVHGTAEKISKGKYQKHNANSDENTENIIKEINSFHKSINQNFGINNCLTKV